MDDYTERAESKKVSSFSKLRFFIIVTLLVAVSFLGYFVIISCDHQRGLAYWDQNKNFSSTVTINNVSSFPDIYFNFCPFRYEEEPK